MSDGKSKILVLVEGAKTDVKLDDMQTEDEEDPFLEDEDEDVDEYEAEDNTPTEKAKHYSVTDSEPVP